MIIENNKTKQNEFNKKLKKTILQWAAECLLNMEAIFAVMNTT